MKITKRQLRRIIKEEKVKLICESLMNDWDIDALEHLRFDRDIDFLDDASILSVIDQEQFDYPDNVEAYKKLMSAPPDVRTELQKQIDASW